jgi:hypothetical protein
MQKMAAVKAKLDAANASLKLIKRRNDLVTEFSIAVRNYLIMKDEAGRHSIRATWILEQVPLVEAELNERGVIETGPDALRGIKRRGRNLDDEDGEDNEAAHDRSIKKQRRDIGKRQRRKHSRDGAADDIPPSKRPRQDGPTLGSHRRAPGGADAEWAGASRESEPVVAMRLGGDELAMVGTVGRPGPRASKPDDCLLRKKSTGHAAQSLTAPQTGSARIGARQTESKMATLAPPAPGASESPHRRTQAAAPPSATALRNQQSIVPATKRKQSTRQGSRHGVVKVVRSTKVRRGR